MARRVLVADADDATRNLVHLTLQGWDVVEATSMTSALHAVEDRRPDLLLLDAELPERGGAAFGRLLRSRPETATLPVLLLTDLSRPVPESDLAVIDPDGVLPRPFGTFALWDAIEGLLARTL